MTHSVTSMRYACACLLLILSGCGDDGGEDAGRGRGSAACQDWQDAICDFVSGECGLLDRATCDDNYQSVTCNSDDRASECANALNEASCTAAPPNCDLSDLADPAPARQACNDLVSRLCTRAVACGMSDSMEMCEQSIATQIDCSTAVGFTLAYEECLTTIDELSCSAAALPDICNDVIKAAP